mmetsp:Transcript_5748/g.18515  ORF Transcript_5748/g.18515 Transcript_5748/m.18515 type:complete len:311 (-) Transcript_5748:296-1228(-)
MPSEGDLYGLRNALYLGNYQQAVSEAMSLGASTERDFFMYRALIEQGQHRVVMDEVGAQAPVALQAVKMLASYLSGVSKEAVVAQLKEWLTDATARDNWQLILVAATVFLHERDHKEALKISHQSTQIDVMALVVQIYLQMDRPDLARKLVKSMQEQYDDDTLTKLSHTCTTPIDLEPFREHSRNLPIGSRTRGRACASREARRRRTRCTSSRSWARSTTCRSCCSTRWLHATCAWAALTRPRGCCRRRCRSRRTTRPRSSTWWSASTSCRSQRRSSGGTPPSSRSPHPHTRGSQSTASSRRALTGAPTS